MILSVVSGITSFIILLGLTSIEPTDVVIQIAMIVNGTLIVLLALVIGWEAASIFLARQKGKAGARPAYSCHGVVCACRCCAYGAGCDLCVDHP